MTRKIAVFKNFFTLLSDYFCLLFVRLLGGERRFIVASKWQFICYWVSQREIVQGNYIFFCYRHRFTRGSIFFEKTFQCLENNRATTARIAIASQWQENFVSHRGELEIEHCGFSLGAHEQQQRFLIHGLGVWSLSNK
jgi:hypothetical protein